MSRGLTCWPSALWFLLHFMVLIVAIKRVRTNWLDLRHSICVSYQRTFIARDELMS